MKLIGWREVGLGGVLVQEALDATSRPFNGEFDQLQAGRYRPESHLLLRLYQLQSLHTTGECRPHDPPHCPAALVFRAEPHPSIRLGSLTRPLRVPTQQHCKITLIHDELERALGQAQAQKGNVHV